MIPQILVAVLSNPVALIAAISPFIINRLQTKRAELDAEAAHRASELRHASEIAEELFSAMDTLAYLTKRAMFGVVFRRAGTGDDREIWRSYQQALMKWESSRATFTAHVEMYFGADNVERLRKIQCDFETLANQVEAAFFERTMSRWFIEDNRGSDNDFRTKFLPLWNELLTEMTDLSKEMISRIQYEEVGTLQYQD